MKIAIIAANGKSGQTIAKEAVERGHQVTAIVRSENKSVAQEVIQKDAFALTQEDLAGFDVLVLGHQKPCRITLVLLSI